MPGAASAGLDERVTPAQVSDSLDAAGSPGYVLDAAIRPLAPGMRAVGRARTVQFAPVEVAPADPYDGIISLIDGAQPGDVVVISTGGSLRTAYWGELFSAAARARGAVGVVCDGYTRDRDKVLAVGFPVFSTGLRPIDFRGRMRVVACQQPVDCGGVLVTPGDLIVAGDDGVVVVPRAVEAEVVAAANQRATTESQVLAELEAGARLRQVWDRHGVL